MGAGALPLREQPRGRDGEDAVRPLLHQAHVSMDGPDHPVRHVPGLPPQSHAGDQRARQPRGDARHVTSMTQAWWVRPEESRSASRDAESPAAFAGVVAFTLVLLLSPQTWFPILGNLRVACLTAGAAGAFLLWDRWNQRRPLLNLHPQMLVAFGLPLWAFMPLPLSYWPGGSASLLAEMYLK